MGLDPSPEDGGSYAHAGCAHHAQQVLDGFVEVPSRAACE
jgi:hypothetical protein